MLQKPLHFARQLIAGTLKNGGFAVDATCGNGYDTVFLAKQVGPEGRVMAFDIQVKAISATRLRLNEAGLSERVTLVEDSHAKIELYCKLNLDAVMFNLGYLPGGDHDLVTQPRSTVAALTFCTSKLNPGGIITLVVYTGHQGGREEYLAVREYVAALPQTDYAVMEYSFINQINSPPLLLAISRL